MRAPAVASERWRVSNFLPLAAAPISCLFCDGDKGEPAPQPKAHGLPPKGGSSSSSAASNVTRSKVSYVRVLVFRARSTSPDPPPGSGSLTFPPAASLYRSTDTLPLLSSVSVSSSLRTYSEEYFSISDAGGILQESSRRGFGRLMVSGGLLGSMFCSSPGEESEADIAPTTPVVRVRVRIVVLKAFLESERLTMTKRSCLHENLLAVVSTNLKRNLTYVNLPAPSIRDSTGSDDAAHVLLAPPGEGVGTAYFAPARENNGELMALDFLLHRSPPVGVTTPWKATSRT